MSVASGPITRLAAAVRGRRLSATRLVSASIERLERHGALNVIADQTFDRALAEAARADDEGPRGPLAGIPTLIKDLEDLAGRPTRQGSLALVDAPAALADGLSARRLRAAGAIVLGKSTLPEFAIEGYTANRLTGVTRNPWNPDYSPGGSSGGSAASIAAGLVGVATATDGGGSVRIPAALCGLVGLKPTNGVIGRWPTPDWIDLSTDGPLASASDDLALLLSVLRGPVAGDPTALPIGRSPIVTPRPTRLIAAPRTSPHGPLEVEVVRALAEGVAALEDVVGRRAEWHEPEDFFDDGDPDLDWFTLAATEHVAALGRDWIARHEDEFHVATRAFLDLGRATGVDEYLAARRRRFGYVRALDELLGDDAVLVTPTVASSGWLADGRLTPEGEIGALPARVISTAVQNVTGHPALSLPYGRLSTGLPFGLQVTAARFDDERLIELAAAFEEAYPWLRTAPGYEPLDALV